MNPLARKNDLFVEHLPNEVVLYDKSNNKVHCLNKTAAAIWESSDGTRSVDDLAQIVGAKLGLPSDPKLVLLALEELEKADLMEAGSVMVPVAAIASRRAAMGKMIMAGSALVVTIVASAPMAHASTKPCATAKPCTTTSALSEKFMPGGAGIAKQAARVVPAKLVK
jgi:hypothetical protein